MKNTFNKNMEQDKNKCCKRQWDKKQKDGSWKCDSCGNITFNLQ